MMTFTFDLTPQDDGSLLITSPDFRNLVLEAATETDALDLARHAAEEAVSMAILGGGRLPASRPHGKAPNRHRISLPDRLATKAKLYQLCQHSDLPFEQLARSAGLTPEKLADLIDPREQADTDHLDRLIARFQNM
ncbi:MAG: hypothetical protein Alpg2KO_05920 [Alphaproteobacteria bacterium]